MYIYLHILKNTGNHLGLCIVVAGAVRGCLFHTLSLALSTSDFSCFVDVNASVIVVVVVVGMGDI